VRRLIVNPDTDSAWEISLRSGIATLGRVDGNDIVLDHPSISDLHCEINAMSSGVTVKDLGSSSGTFIGDEPVTESLLLPGQILRLGDVQLRLTDTTPAAAAAPALAKIIEPSVTTLTAGARCKYHPRNPPRFHCLKCHGNFCEMCVNMRLVGGESKTFCRACAVECAPVEIKVEAPVEISFSR
jgi:hypothetical protein